MKNKMIKLICVSMVVFLLSACGNSNSKVDQVIQDQMQSAETETSQEEDIVAYDNFVENEIVEQDVEKDEFVTKEDEFVTNEDGIDLDLTQLSSTMVYSEVYTMMYEPSEYIGKSVKMNGAFSVYQNEETGQIYFACIISDATACCSQGIEFELEGEYTYPDDYPERGEEITVTGVFETYEEDGNLFCRLQNAKML